jgi:hypothetical protein
MLSFLFINRKKSGWILTLKQSAKFLIITGIFLVALFPFLWTDSITFAKSFFGNIFMKTSGKGNSLNTLMFDYLPSLITYPGIILSFIGLILSFNKLGKGKTVFLVLTFLLFAYPIANASQTYERYSLALLPMLLIWASFGFNYIVEKIKNPVILKGSIAAIIIICTFQSSATIWNEFETYHEKSNFILCRTWLNENFKENEKIAMPVSFENYFYENKDCLSRIIKRNSDSILITQKLQTQIRPEYNGRLLNVRAVILEDLFLDEKKFLDQKYRVKYDFVSSHPVHGKVFNIYYYTEKAFTSLHCFKYTEVMKDTSVKYFLTENKQEMSLTLLKKFDSFNDTPYYLYLKEEKFNYSSQ